MGLEWRRQSGIPAVAILAAAVLYPASAAVAAPVVTAANVTVDVSGATGSSGQLIVGDAVVCSWDNSASGDDNSDVTELSQVVFDVFGIVSLQADSVAAGVFSLTYIVGPGDGDLNGVSAGVTASSPGGSTGPVYGTETVDVDGDLPTVSPENLLVDFAGASGSGGTFHPGDTIVVSWDDSATGDDNADVVLLTQIEFDFFGLFTVNPDDASGGVFSYTYVFQETDPDLPGVSFEATVVDDAGNMTGPVESDDVIDFSSEPPPAVPALSPPAVLVLGLLLAWLAMRPLGQARRSRARSEGGAPAESNRGLRARSRLEAGSSHLGSAS